MDVDSTPWGKHRRCSAVGPHRPQCLLVSSHCPFQVSPVTPRGLGSLSKSLSRLESRGPCQLVRSDSPSSACSGDTGKHSVNAALYFVINRFEHCLLGSLCPSPAWEALRWTFLFSIVIGVRCDFGRPLGNAEMLHLGQDGNPGLPVTLPSRMSSNSPSSAGRQSFSVFLSSLSPLHSRLNTPSAFGSAGQLSWD